jgi:hypothetical protein
MDGLTKQPFLMLMVWYKHRSALFTDLLDVYGFIILTVAMQDLTKKSKLLINSIKLKHAGLIKLTWMGGELCIQRPAL